MSGDSNAHELDDALYLLSTVTTSDLELIHDQRDVAVFDLERVVQAARDLLVHAKDGPKDRAALALDRILDHIDTSNDPENWKVYFRKRIRLVFWSKECNVPTLSCSGSTLVDATKGIVTKWPSLAAPELLARPSDRPAVVFLSLAVLVSAVGPDNPSSRQALDVARVRRTLRRRDLGPIVGRTAGEALNAGGYPWWYPMDWLSSFHLSLLAALLCP